MHVASCCMCIKVTNYENTLIVNTAKLSGHSGIVSVTVTVTLAYSFILMPEKIYGLVCFI